MRACPSSAISVPASLTPAAAALSAFPHLPPGTAGPARHRAKGYRLAPGAPETGRRCCRHFPTYQDAVAWCLAHHGSTTGCGGLDRDRDGLPCECNPGGPEADERACVNRSEEKP